MTDNGVDDLLTGENPLSSEDSARSDDTLTISYDSGRKILVLIIALFACPFFFFIMLPGNELAAQLSGIFGLAWSFFAVREYLFTRAVVLTPDRVTKQRSFGRETTIPSRTLVIMVDSRRIRLFHGSKNYFRERIVISRLMITAEDVTSIRGYAEKFFGIELNDEVLVGEASVEVASSAPEHQVGKLLLSQFHQSLKSYKLAIPFLMIMFTIVFFIRVLSGNFSGFVIPEAVAWGRWLFMAVAIGAYPLLKRCEPGRLLAQGPEQSGMERLTWTQRTKKLENRESLLALISSGVAVLGVVQFFFSGNLLDFFVFTLTALYYYYDFFPRLSVWERGMGKAKPADPFPEPSAATIPDLPRRSSLQVSLVLMGALAVSSYGESQHYLYRNRQDCLNDWGDGKNCEEPQTGSMYYRTGYYYGPRTSNVNGPRAARSVSSVTVSRGGFGSLGSFHASFGG